MNRRWLSGCCALSLIAVLAAAGSALAQDASPPLDAFRLVDQRALQVEDSRIISMSPDGQWLAVIHPGIGYQRGRLCTVAVSTLVERACADLAGLEAGIRLEDVTWSPDSSQLAFAEMGMQTLTDGDLWLMDAATGALSNLDDDGFVGRVPLPRDHIEGTPITLPVNPAFSPDGTTIAFSRSILDGSSPRNTIATVPVEGGPVTDLLTVTDDAIGYVYFGIAWAPDGKRIYYSYQSQSQDDLGNGVWVVDADGTGARLLVGKYQEGYGPTVLDVSSDGETLLLQDPAAMGGYANRLPVYATADTTHGTPTPLLPLSSDHSKGTFVGWAGFSPDGSTLATLYRLTNPELQVWLRPVDGTTESPLVPDGLEAAGPIDRGIPMTWSPNGTLLLTGAGQFGTSTLLPIEGGTAP